MNISSSHHNRQQEWQIAHFDCDCFFAAVEKRDRPELMGKPLVVAGDSARAVVAAACYLARLYGIHSAMPVAHAKKKCAHLVIVPHRFPEYRNVKQQVADILKSSGIPLKFDMIDEGYLSLADYDGDRLALCRDLQNQIRDKLNITLSFGLGPNAVMAKIIGNMDKPNGLKAMDSQTIRAWLQDKPISILPGVGPATQARLRKIGMTRISQLHRIHGHELATHLGKFAYQLQEMILAQPALLDMRPRPYKNISTEQTFHRDFPADEKFYQHLTLMSQQISAKLKKQQKGCYTVSLKLRTGTFQTLSRNFTTQEPIQNAEDIARIGHYLLEQATAPYPDQHYRLLGLGVAKFSDHLGTLPLFAPEDTTC